MFLGPRLTFTAEISCKPIFKLLLLTYKSLDGLAPVCINELLHHSTPRRSLRSSDSNFL